MTARNIILIVVVLAVIAGIVVGLIFGLREEKPAAPSTIKLGVDVPLSGKFESLGKQTLRGYEIAVEDINAAGGVYIAEFGKRIPLELIVKDDESDATKVVENMESLAGEGIWAYLGPAGSALHDAATPVAEANKTPYFGIGFGLKRPHTLGYRYIFAPFIKMDTIPVVAFEMLNSLPLADWTRDVTGDGVDETYSGRENLKVAIFEIATEGGRELAVAARAEATKFGYPVVYQASHSPGETDFSSLVAGAKAAGANVLFSFPTPPQGPTIVTEMKTQGWDVQHNFMVRAPDLPTWSDATGADGDYVINPMGWSPYAPWKDEPLPSGISPWRTVAELNSRYNELGYGTVADPLTGPAYACVQILVDSMERAGKLDRTAIRDAIAAFDGLTVAGPFTFNADGTGNTTWMVYQVLNQKKELVWPALYQSATWQPIPPWSVR